jgi:hypothetical protein
MPAAGGNWIARVNEEFWKAFESWFQPPYTTYETSFDKLKYPVMQLAAAAYLHIAYDLPCVLARNFSPLADVTEAEAEAAYFSLEPIFRTTVIRAAKNMKVVGWWGLLARIFPSTVLKTLAFWMMYLRSAAWTHGRFLATLSENERDIRQTAILTAVTDALKDLIESGQGKPWNVEKLRSPHGSVYSFLFPLLAMYFVVSFDLRFWIAIALIGAGALTVISYLIRSWLRRTLEDESFFRPAPVRKRMTKIFLYDEVARHKILTASFSEFVDQLGWFTAEYVNAAVRNPETYNTFRLKFRSDNGALGPSDRL